MCRYHSALQAILDEHESRVARCLSIYSSIDYFNFGVVSALGWPFKDAAALGQPENTPLYSLVTELAGRGLSTFAKTTNNAANIILLVQ